MTLSIEQKFHPLDIIYQTPHCCTHQGAVWYKKQLTTWLLNQDYFNMGEYVDLRNWKYSLQQMCDLACIIILSKGGKI